MKKLTLGAIALAASTVIGGSASHANLLITGEAWANQSTLAANATINGAPNPATTPPDAIFTASDINFHSNSNTDTLSNFILSNPGTATITGGANPNAPLQNSYFLLRGTTGISNGTYSVTHDDGVQLDIAGLNGIEVDQPGAAPLTVGQFNVTGVPTATNHAFTLSYGECCSVPAELFSSLPEATVPEPASLALLGSALVGFGLMRRRRKTS